MFEPVSYYYIYYKRQGSDKNVLQNRLFVRNLNKNIMVSRHVSKSNAHKATLPFRPCRIAHRNLNVKWFPLVFSVRFKPNILQSLCFWKGYTISNATC